MIKKYALQLEEKDRTGDSKVLGGSRIKVVAENTLRIGSKEIVYYISESYKRAVYHQCVVVVGVKMGEVYLDESIKPVIDVEPVIAKELRAEVEKGLRKRLDLETISFWD